MMEYQRYLDEKVHQLRIVCQAQWDYLRYSDACEWLDSNFQNDLQGQYFGTKILLHTVYYSKRDLEKLLSYGLNEKIYGELLKSELIANDNIYITNSDASARIHQMQEASFFIPLSDSDKPQESGNLVIGDLIHKLGFATSQVDFVKNVTQEKLKRFKMLVFVDDCIGSGNQLRRFWNSREVNEIKRICKEQGMPIYFLVLVGYKNNLEELIYGQEITGIQIVVCDLLTDKNRIFSKHNIIWEQETSELQGALSYFKDIQQRKGVSFLGYDKLDFAVILHNRVPDWSSPIFWREIPGWKYLLRRKNSKY